VAFRGGPGGAAVASGEGGHDLIVVGGRVLGLVREHVEEVRRHHTDRLADQRQDAG
jgi:hypothetical protein